jgi:hypothetical protein
MVGFGDNGVQVGNIKDKVGFVFDGFNEVRQSLSLQLALRVQRQVGN